MAVDTRTAITKSSLAPLNRVSFIAVLPCASQNIPIVSEEDVHSNTKIRRNRQLTFNFSKD
jgi:hypothetical protein